MKQRLIIIASLILLLGVIGFIVRDLFFAPDADPTNPYDYRLNDWKRSDTSQIAYREIVSFQPGLDTIRGIATDHENNIYVCGEGGIERYTREGVLIDLIPIEGSVRCMTISPQGDLILGMQNRVAVLSKAGDIRRAWDLSGQKTVITSIATNGSDIFVADAGERIVNRFDYSGVLLNTLGKKDTLQGVPGFIVPGPYFDLWMGRDDEVWVVNPGRHTLEAYLPDGKLISSWGRTSMGLDGFCGCCNPTHFMILSNGSFVTSEKGIERVKVFLPSGEFLELVASTETFHEGTKGVDLATDSEDRILMLDPVRNQVRIFERKQTR